MQNGFIERFHRSYREAVLDMFVFQSLEEVREQTEKWLLEYNEESGHMKLWASKRFYGLKSGFGFLVLAEI